MTNPSKNFLDFRLLPGFKKRDSRQGSLFYTYSGNSMAPTLQEPELMEVMPFRGNSIKRGDVVCFFRQGESIIVVHRVVRINGRGVTTRGDNNQTEDNWNLTEEQVIGRVIAAWRGFRRRKIMGGWLGHLFSRALYGLRHLDRRISHRLSPLYHWLSRGGFFVKLLPINLRPRIVFFQDDGHKQLFMFWGGIMIGRYLDPKHQWVIHRPFRLIADACLLHNSHKNRKINES